MTKGAANSRKKAANAPRGKPFKKGQSGNPAGRKPGVRNKLSRDVMDALRADSGHLTRALIDAARSGDATAHNSLNMRNYVMATEHGDFPGTLSGNQKGEDNDLNGIDNEDNTLIGDVDRIIEKAKGGEMN